MGSLCGDIMSLERMWFLLLRMNQLGHFDSFNMLHSLEW